jgi:glycolate oxidase iron-sulfur subunit
VGERVNATEALSAFESHAFAGLDSCVHCGFCLPACPTYEVTSDEADSPRGRILLMRALIRGELPPEDESLASHLDRCLGCRGCESVCPSGVVFGPALEAARARIALARPLPVALRVALWVLARPERQRLLWMFSRLLRRTGLPALIARGAGARAPRVASMLAMLAATRPDKRAGRRPDRKAEDGASHLPPATSSRAPVASRLPAACLFRGCVMDGLFSHIHDATVVALRVNGLSTREVRGQVCCGALAAHAGAHEMAKDLARENVRVFAATGGPIVVNSAGCGAALKSYGDLLAGDPLEADARAVAARVRDVSEVLAELGPRPGRALALRVAYDAPCHLLHAQKIKDAPRALLEAIPGLEQVPLEGSERCCGSAGLYSLIEPELSQEVLALKVAAIRRTAPDVVVTGNPGCLMQIGAGTLLEGLSVSVRHPVELLAWSYTE